jgi:hypothetical protein
MPAITTERLAAAQRRKQPPACKTRGYRVLDKSLRNALMNRRRVVVADRSIRKQSRPATHFRGRPWRSAVSRSRVLRRSRRDTFRSLREPRQSSDRHECLDGRDAERPYQEDYSLPLLDRLIQGDYSRRFRGGGSGMRARTSLRKCTQILGKSAQPSPGPVGKFRRNRAKKLALRTASQVRLLRSLPAKEIEAEDFKNESPNNRGKRDCERS